MIDPRAVYGGPHSHEQMMFGSEKEKPARAAPHSIRRRSALATRQSNCSCEQANRAAPSFSQIHWNSRAGSVKNERETMGPVALMPDPRPLMNGWGRAFFREARRTQAYYLMRMRGHGPLCRQAKKPSATFASYRIANPDRMPRRHLRMLRQVARIGDRVLHRTNRPRSCANRVAAFIASGFNRAGVWPGK